MAQFQKGHKLATGRPKGSKNRITNDVRECFHRVYDEMGADKINPDTDKPYTGAEAMLLWARDNPTEFYRLYGKMIPQTAEITGDVHEDYLEFLVLEEELTKNKLIEAKAKVVDITDMGNNGHNETR